MPAEENKALVRRGIEEGWTRGNLDLFDEIAAGDVMHHPAAGPTVPLWPSHSNHYNLCSAA